MANVVLAALHEQVDCYRALATLADEQQEHVRQDDSEQLLRVLQRRQQLLDCAVRLQQTTGPARRLWPRFLEGLSSGDRAAATAVVAEIRQLLERITEADRNDTMVLQQRKISRGRSLHPDVVRRPVDQRYAAAAYATTAARADAPG